jgi:hypothetical protein
MNSTTAFGSDADLTVGQAYCANCSGVAATYLYYAYLLIWPIYFGFVTYQFLQRQRVLSWSKGILAAILSWASTQGLATLAGLMFS